MGDHTTGWPFQGLYIDQLVMKEGFLVHHTWEVEGEMTKWWLEETTQGCFWILGVSRGIR